MNMSQKRRSAAGLLAISTLVFGGCATPQVSPVSPPEPSPVTAPLLTTGDTEHIPCWNEWLELMIMSGTVTQGEVDQLTPADVAEMEQYLLDSSEETGVSIEQFCAEISNPEAILTEPGVEPSYTDVEIPWEFVTPFREVVSTPDWMIGVGLPYQAEEEDILGLNGTEVGSSDELWLFPLAVTNNSGTVAEPWSIMAGCWVIDTGEAWCETQIHVVDELWNVGELSDGEYVEAVIPILLPAWANPDNAFGAFALEVEDDLFWVSDVPANLESSNYVTNLNWTRQS